MTFWPKMFGLLSYLKGLFYSYLTFKSVIKTAWYFNDHLWLNIKGSHQDKSVHTEMVIIRRLCIYPFPYTFLFKFNRKLWEKSSFREKIRWGGYDGWVLSCGQLFNWNLRNNYDYESSCWWRVIGCCSRGCGLTCQLISEEYLQQLVVIVHPYKIAYIITISAIYKIEIAKLHEGSDVVNHV